MKRGEGEGKRSEVSHRSLEGEGLAVKGIFGRAARNKKLWLSLGISAVFLRGILFFKCYN